MSMNPPSGGPSAEAPSSEVLRSESGWDRRMARIREVPLRISVQIGQTKMPIGAVLELRVGQVIELDRQVGAPVDIVANEEVVVARGEVVEVDDEYGVRITEIVPGALG
ncbi:MAG: CheC, inhibitor of methylation [Acidimicrobiaceae bacterium]|nr:CheC, inhibitor of methylation [Acidimicrobiaceae bacterium]